jgi:hypothetical protein
MRNAASVILPDTSIAIISHAPYHVSVEALRMPQLIELKKEIDKQSQCIAGVTCHQDLNKKTGYPSKTCKCLVLHITGPDVKR